MMLEIEIVDGNSSEDQLADGDSEDHPDTYIGLGEEVIYINRTVAYSRTVSLPITYEEDRDRRKVQNIIKVLFESGYKNIETVQKMPGRQIEHTTSSCITPL